MATRRDEIGRARRPLISKERRDEAARHLRVKDLKYATLDRRGSAREVLCKVTGNPIIGYVEDDQKRVVRREPGRVTIERYMIQTVFEGYTEATLIMDDGSRHVTCLHSAALARLNDPDVLKAVYTADVAMLEEEMNMTGGQLDLERVAARVPVEVEK